jgi:hypothetical protein
MDKDEVFAMDGSSEPHNLIRGNLSGELGNHFKGIYPAI